MRYRNTQNTCYPVTNDWRVDAYIETLGPSAIYLDVLLCLSLVKNLFFLFGQSLLLGLPNLRFSLLSSAKFAGLNTPKR